MSLLEDEGSRIELITRWNCNDERLFVDDEWTRWLEEPILGG
jgi:hypothetical protein